ncbi:MAG: PadR family transcriptional regulator [Candidatus Geothermarchaeales archaeon]
MLLYEGPLHGYGIMSAVKERMDIDVSPSLVYPFLRQLEERGFVKHTIETIGSKEKKVYSLTDEGRNLAFRVFKRLSSIVDTAIQPNLNICVHCGCKVYGSGYTEKIRSRELLFCCSHCAASYKHELTSEEQESLRR